MTQEQSSARSPNATDVDTHLTMDDGPSHVTTSPGRLDGTPGTLEELGAALGLMAPEIARRTIATWEMGDAASTLNQFGGRVSRMAESTTQLLAHQLMTGEEASSAQDEELAEVGEEAASAAIALAHVTSVYLFWRDAVFEVLEDEADRLRCAPLVLEQARSAVYARSDKSLVAMAEQFDGRRKFLQKELDAERERLAHQALHDVLTGLPNRILFVERLSQAIEAAERRSVRSAVLFVDIDRFKSVNDVAGHAAGDRLIQGVGERLKEVLRPGDTVARLGGDEFVVLCENLYDASGEATLIAGRICETISMPFSFNAAELFCTCSIGISFVKAGDDAAVLVSRADSAMYMAKQNGRARYELYHPDFDHRVTRRGELLNGLHRAIERDELVLHFQPVKDLVSKRVVSFEALLRWEHPSLGKLAPMEFIPLAEECGLIRDIGRWVLEEAATRCRLWHEEGHREISVSVNVSGKELEDPSFAAGVQEILERTGLRPSSLIMEITESVLVTEGSIGESALADLEALGIRLSIDDFGIGYSSLSYLARLPVHALKVDRSFISGLGTDKDLSILTAMVELAHTLGLGVVAEGVETEEELDALLRAQCDEAQGFLLGRPAPLDSWRQEGFLESPQ